MVILRNLTLKDYSCLYTALDAKNEGKTLWSVGTGPGSMLSSTISQVELTSNAQFVRLIPSLAGGEFHFLI